LFTDTKPQQLPQLVSVWKNSQSESCVHAFEYLFGSIDVCPAVTPLLPLLPDVDDPEDPDEDVDDCDGGSELPLVVEEPVGSPGPPVHAAMTAATGNTTAAILPAFT
jgi:hypothetical protein